MPTTKKEKLYFGMIMCCGMVLVMTIYNVIINGLFGTVPISGLVTQFILGLIIALLLDLYIVGPVAQKLVSMLPFDKSKTILHVLFMSFFMVVGMVLFMSLYGLVTAILAGGLGDVTLVKSYATLVLKNFVLALPLQLIVMGPLVRYIFMTFVKGNGAINQI